MPTARARIILQNLEKAAELKAKVYGLTPGEAKFIGRFEVTPDGDVKVSIPFFGSFSTAEQIPPTVTNKLHRIVNKDWEGKQL